ncbi:MULTISPECIES: restriction endonuclease subunit S [unclassified Bradyrhizobium]|nr:MULTISPECIES: restriction endonuclease subunit S [unclassified Bradyrhizobium]UPJ95373.1 restriction endonuclease subunit S [Bradyrhizobium sp. 172]
MVRVDQAGSVRLGRQRSPDKHTGRNATKYLRAANITPEGIDLKDLLEMDFTAAERATFALRVGDVLLTEASGSAAQVGRAGLWRGEIENCCYQNTVIRFRPHLALPEYAMVAFQHFSVSGVFARVARGVGIQHLGASRFAELAFPLPPLNEQRRIAEVTKRRRAEIREARNRLQSALAHLNEQVRETMAAAIAGELAPQRSVVGSHEQASPERSRTSSRQPRRKAEPPSLFNYAERDGNDIEVAAGPLPSNWRWANVGDVGNVTVGRQRSPGKHTGRHATKYVRAANITPHGLDLTDLLEMDFTPAEREIFALQVNDVLLTEASGSGAQVGRAALWKGEVDNCCFQNTVIRFRPHSVTPEYALLVFQHYGASGIFAQAARGVGIQHLGASRFAALPFPLPPLEEQARIVDEARSRLDGAALQIEAVNTSLSRLPEMEKELLAAAVGGELTPQDPTDEPATALLERLGPPQRDMATYRPADVESGETPMSTKRASPSQKLPLTSDLAAVLREAGRPLSLPELFSQAGFDRDQPEHVEVFYLALRTQLGQTIRKIGHDIENAELEAINAP